MWRKRDIIRVILFVIFFSIGVAALAGSILSSELLGCYRNRQLEAELQANIEKTKSLIADYDALLQQLEEDPNLIRRIAPVILGAKPPDTNAVYPKARAEQLAAARRALMEDLERQKSWPAVPPWLIRCSQPRSRALLLSAGACLILISLVCFGPEKASSSAK